MTFFPPAPPNGVAYEQATKLYNALRSKRLTNQSQAQILSLTKVLVRLHKAHGVEAVGLVLDWYIAHLGDEFTPCAYSASALLVKYPQLERAMQRVDDETSDVDQRWRDLSERIQQDYILPTEISIHLPRILQQSHQNWFKFYAIMANLNTEGRDYRFTRHIMEAHPTFTQEWGEYLGYAYNKMRSYTGAPLGLAWKPDSVRFCDAFWRKWAQEWCSNHEAFDELLKDLIKEYRK
jgi:hypothetical protein